ncbi:MAG: dihydroneopterin aldolase [Thermoanaerobaculaceae bacterium]|nr:dihydroneopterin aldolase [Thermoanaerobaculaceae bacterium]MDI9622021.1 dihydroneopterin aldolase [Acidobacteriota bacterium]NLH11757.1 dihydroneopterin aldolase [Holophagae bacterium]HPW54811.1 dihydroneopterin aldolase [Thermoanaerobaculaceae bacterium]
MTDTVFVHDLEVECLVGTEPDERLGAQLLTVDVDAVCDCGPAGRTDRLDDTVDYVHVVEIVRERAAASRFHLLEALASDIATTLLARLPRAEAVRVRVVKPEALAGVPSVGVELVRRRQQGAA